MALRKEEVEKAARINTAVGRLLKY